MFGWDWGAHLPDAGIFRPVYLGYVKNASVDQVYIRQKHEENLCTLDFEVQWNREQEGEYQLQAVLRSPKGEVFEIWLSLEGKGSLEVLNPQLWWVNGLGEQPLYNVQVNLFRNGELEDCWERRIGLRHMTIRREKDQWGGEFCP